MINVKTLIAGILVASAVTLGGCHVFKKPQAAKSADVTVMAKTSQPVVSLSSLNDRLTAVEGRLNAARAARAKLRATVAEPVPVPVKKHFYSAF